MCKCKPSDADKTAAVMAAYDALPPEDKQRIMDLDKRLEQRIEEQLAGRKIMRLGRIGRLEVLAAIGKIGETV